MPQLTKNLNSGTDHPSSIPSSTPWLDDRAWYSAGSMSPYLLGLLGRLNESLHVCALSKYYLDFIIPLWGMWGCGNTIFPFLTETNTKTI